MGVIYIITSPNKAFERIREKRDWWLPFIIVVIIAMVAYMLVSPLQLKIVKANPPPDLLPEAVEKMEQARYLGLLFVPVGAILWYLIIALGIWAVGSVAGGKWEYLDAFTLTVYSSMVNALENILSIVVILIKRNTINTLRELSPSFGPAILYTGNNMKILKLLRGLDFFTIWFVILLILGVSHLSGIKRRSSAMLITLLYIILVAIRVFMPSRGL